MPKTISPPVPNHACQMADSFAGNLLSEVRQLPQYTSESDQGTLVNISQLEPFIDCVSRCAGRVTDNNLNQFSTCLIDYLSYLQGLESQQHNKLMVRLQVDGEGLSCIPVKQRKIGFTPAPKRDRVYVKDVAGTKYISDKKTISFEAFYQLRQQAQAFAATPQACQSNADFARQQLSTGKSIAGHGALDKDFEYFKLPANIRLCTYGVQGQTMPDRVGIHIEAGRYDDVAHQTFKRVYNPGNFMPDYRIYPPDERINTLPGSITVPHPTYLSKIIEILSAIAEKTGETMTLDLATCQSYILPELATHPKENIKARLDILERDLTVAKDEYGAGIPEEIRQHMRHSLDEIVTDASRKGLYAPRRTHLALKGQQIASRIEKAKAAITQMDAHCYMGAIEV